VVKNPQVLVLAPTRELCVQIFDEVEKYGRACGLKAACCYGGASKGPQVTKLSAGVDIVVATPGRCNDLMESGYLNLSKVNYLVLDEADRMLDMGFEPQIREILSDIPEDRQSLFFTATWPREVQHLAREFLTNPVHIEIGDQDQLNANKAITQNVIVLTNQKKHNALVDILENMANAEETTNSAAQFPKTIIFRSRKIDCDRMAEDLFEAGFTADSLHGDKSQMSRDKVMNQFRSGKIRILVATDVAARGLDIKDIDTVINYDFPADGVESYVHRIGRTARGVNKGSAYTFFTPNDRSYAKELVDLLQRCEQEVPQALSDMTNSFRGGSGGSNRFSSRFSNGSNSGNNGGRYSSSSSSSPFERRSSPSSSSSSYGGSSSSSRYGDYKPSSSRFGGNDSYSSNNNDRFSRSSSNDRSSSRGSSSSRSNSFGGDGDDSLPPMRRSSSFASGNTSSYTSRFGSNNSNSNNDEDRFSKGYDWSKDKKSFGVDETN
jgi:ATP-dependent RNA helicase DDX5/DBP2